MSSLIEMQRNLADYIYDKSKAQIIEQINTDNISKERRLKVYHNNVIGSFDDVLADVYTTVKRLVGDDYFNGLAARYHQTYRSKSGNMNEYGVNFAQFIQSLTPEHKLLYLTDIAKLEWLFHDIYFAADTSKTMDLEALQALKEDQYFNISFEIHPSCAFLESQYPIHSIYNSVNSEQKINIDEHDKEIVLLERCLFDVNIHKLSELEYLFLQEIKQGKTIYNIYEALIEKDPQFDIGSLINKYISIGVLSNFNN
ncbi:MAG: DNA-binding domain-containing protein [Proteobacteria bacterium]|nr:DNA-binding domain-containing protein [Pseudomonadota bacterium]